MTLLNAPKYDSGKENRKTGLVIGGLGLILLAAVVGVGGYLLGHYPALRNPFMRRISAIGAAIGFGA